MDNSNQGNTEKNLISRRTLLNNSLLSGIGLAAGIYLNNLPKIPVTAIKNGEKNDTGKKPDDQSDKDTYIDNFDC